MVDQDVPPGTNRGEVLSPSLMTAIHEARNELMYGTATQLSASEVAKLPPFVGLPNLGNTCSCLVLLVGLLPRVYSDLDSGPYATFRLHQFRSPMSASFPSFQPDYGPRSS
jgi:hypothetical protein